MTTETIAPQAPQNGVPRAAEEMQVEEGITLAENEHLSARPKSEIQAVVFILAMNAFLAPLSILSGMIAEQGDSWKLVFTG
jgi:hypothetical protein